MQISCGSATRRSQWAPGTSPGATAVCVGAVCEGPIGWTGPHSHRLRQHLLHHLAALDLRVAEIEAPVVADIEVPFAEALRLRPALPGALCAQAVVRRLTSVLVAVLSLPLPHRLKPG